MNERFFRVSLQPGKWKWWFSIVVFFLSIVMFVPQRWVLISILVPILLTLRVSNSDQGLVTTNFTKTIFIGVLSFLFFTVLVYFVENSSKEVSEAGKKVLDEFGFGQSSKRDWSKMLLICFWAPLSEELLYRGVFFRTIWNSLCLSKKLSKHKQLIAFIIASNISSFLFMSAHGGRGQDNQLVMLFVLGMLACVSYVITGSIYAPVIFHSLNNSYVLFNSNSNFADANMKYYILLMPIVVCLVLFGIQQTLKPLEKFDFRTFKKI